MILKYMKKSTYILFHIYYYIPNATAQVSLSPSFFSGAIVTTGLSRCLTSHTLTEPLYIY